MISNQNEIRLERERLLQNAKYTDYSARAHAAKYYAAGESAHRFYERLLGSTVVEKDVLELGSGAGSYANFLSAAGARNVVGIDISDVAIEQSRLIARSNVQLMRMNAEAMTFPDKRFDVVCGGAILHHLDMAAAVPEIRRVLRPNGAAIFLEPLGHNPLINLYRRLTPQMRTPDEHPLRQSDINALREQFAILEVKAFNLTTLACVNAKGLIPLAERVDRVLFRIPAVARWAWIVVITAHA